MKILTVEEKQIDLSEIGDSIPVTHYAVVDLGSDMNTLGAADITFPKLLYITDQTSHAVVCDIEGVEVTLPLSWNLFIGDEDSAEVEALPITELNARNFQVILTNPASGFRHRFADIRIKTVLIEYEWTMPRLKNGQALAVPINSKNECLYITSSLSKIPPTSCPADFL